MVVANGTLRQLIGAASGPADAWRATTPAPAPHQGGPLLEPRALDSLPPLDEVSTTPDPGALYAPCRIVTAGRDHRLYPVAAGDGPDRWVIALHTTARGGLDVVGFALVDLDAFVDHDRRPLERDREFTGACACAIVAAEAAHAANSDVFDLPAVGDL
jgi:hypothetical protein